MNKVDIYIPTFGRSEKLVDYTAHIKSVTPLARVVCIVEPDDPNSHGIGDVTVINSRSKNYAGAINSAYLALKSEYFFAGADDLRFYPDWLDIAMSKMEGNIRVVGTNDLHNEEVKRGEHATHYLVDGRYVTEFGGNLLPPHEPLLPEIYNHNYTDREAIGVAKYRGVFAPCLESVVEHLHFTFGLSQMDETYQKTRVRVDHDSQVYESRRSAWNRL